MILSPSELDELDSLEGGCLSGVSLAAVAERDEEDADAAGGNRGVLRGLEGCCCFRKMFGDPSCAAFVFPLELDDD